MNRIIIYTETLQPEILADVFPMHRAVQVFSRSECAQALLTETAVDALFLESSRVDASLGSFILALCRHFPLLKIVLITSGLSESLPAQVIRIDSAGGQRSMLRLATASVDAFAQREQRENRRFDWPLRGFVAPGDGEERWSEVRIRSLSSTGAFLETSETSHAPGAHCRVRIEFQGMRLRAGATVVRCEMGQGCGLRFQSLGDQAQAFLDRIVHDAFVAALLDPDADARPPVLGGEALLIPEFELT